jgi:hypothetical protein
MADSRQRHFHEGDNRGRGHSAANNGPKHVSGFPFASPLWLFANAHEVNKYEQ